MRIVKYEVTAFVPDGDSNPRCAEITNALAQNFLNDDGTGVGRWKVEKTEEETEE